MLTEPVIYCYFGPKLLNHLIIYDHISILTDDISDETLRSIIKLDENTILTISCQEPTLTSLHHHEIDDVII